MRLEMCSYSTFYLCLLSQPLFFHFIRMKVFSYSFYDNFVHPLSFIVSLI